MLTFSKLVKLVTKIHTRLIRFNHTKIGSIILGGNILLLETKGRNTNLIRKVPLTYVELSDSYLVAASYGGRDVHPEWFLNIQINNGNVVVKRLRHFFLTVSTYKQRESHSYLWT